MGKYKPTGRPRGRPRKQPEHDPIAELLGLTGDEPEHESQARVARDGDILAPDLEVRAPAAAPEKKKRAPMAHWWKPGQSGNPSGGRAHDPALKALKRMTKDELAKIGQLVLDGDYETLVELAGDRSASVLAQMLASVCLRIINKGDHAALDTLLNRIVGKVKDELDVGGTGLAARVVVTLPSNGREAKTA